MIRKFHIWVWGIVMELEYQLYPWKTKDPPQWAIERYNLDNGIHDQFEADEFYFGWIKMHKEMIERLQTEMITIQEKVRKLEEANVQRTGHI